MYFKDSEYFITIADEGNLSKAAEKLLISQPAVSKYLSKLEEDFGTKLFIRNNNKLEMTPAGRFYYDASKQIHEIMLNTNNKIQSLAENSKFTLSVGVTGERTHRFLGVILKTMYQKYKKLHISVVEYPALQLGKMIKNGDIDFAIYANDTTDSSLSSEAIKKEEIVLALPSSHKLADYGTTDARDASYKVDLKDLKDELFVLLKPGTTLRDIENKYFSEVGFFPNEIIETKGSLSNLVYVENGLAIGFSPMEYKYESPKIKYIRLNKPFFYSIKLVYRKDYSFSDISSDFRNLVMAQKDLL